MCGASSQQKQAYANEAKVSNMLTTIAQNFAGVNTDMLSEIKDSLTPIQEAGPSQFGLSPAAEAAERTSAAENLNASAAQTANAVRSAVASRGGGTTYLPSGSEASIIGSLAQDTAVKEALAQSAITQKGYDIGRQNFEFATEGLEKAPGAFETPVVQAGSAAAGAASDQMKGADAITQANQAWMQPVGAIIGGVAGGLIPKIPGSSGGGGGGSYPGQTYQGPGGS